MDTIKLQNDFLIDIATAHSRLSKRWRNRQCKWSDLVNRCRETKRTSESVKEYSRMSKEEQSSVKDVGGFVGGYLSGGVRKTTSVMWRSIVTLDIDYGTAELWEDFTLNFDFAAMLYSTHKHTRETPRYRLVFPLSRQVRPDEYEPLCRKIAETVGMDMFDDTTYQLARLFYYPSTSRDGDYVFEYQDGPACDVDAILGMYHDYKDASSWPTSSREGEAMAHEIKKAGDPTEKPGLIGAFCRAYTIQEAIETFLPEVYEPTAHENRYTYRKGSVAAGLVCYEDKFAYSNHETDPASKQLCNAFDLCRIHLYGVQDEGTRVTDVTKLPSYLKMQDFVAKDKRVRTLLTQERRKNAGEDFADVEADDEADDTEDTAWMGDLDFDKRGGIKPTAGNIMAILENDRNLKGRLWYNEFNNYVCVSGGLPWNAKARQWGDMDEANLRIYLEIKYGVTGRDKIKDALVAVITKQRRHPIREYLKGLKWDGTPRLERLVIDYIGAEDNALTRAMTRKHFTAAVARVMNPGCKYDYCLIVTGAEGIGKSTLFNVMGGDWFSDSLVTMEGTKAMEQLRGGWIFELSELGSMKRSDVEQVKAFVSRQDDAYRVAYGRIVEPHPRQCVFCGTTNETHFLKGSTGNRRFWVIEVDGRLRKHEDFRAALLRDRNQLWAEAYHYYKEGEPLYLPADLTEEAKKRQEEHNDDQDDPLPGMVQAFLDMKLPPDWYTWDVNRRRAYIKNPDPLDATGTVTRTRVCCAEFICEVLGKDMADKDYRYIARRVNGVIGGTKGWDYDDHKVATIYGRLRGYARANEFNGDNNAL